MPWKSPPKTLTMSREKLKTYIKSQSPVCIQLKILRDTNPFHWEGPKRILYGSVGIASTQAGPLDTRMIHIGGGRKNVVTSWENFQPERF